MTDYKSMFEQAVRTLAAIDEALGIGDDGCGDPDQTLTAIAELKAAKVGTGRTATVTREMIGAAHDVMLAENERLKSLLTDWREFATDVSAADCGGQDWLDELRGRTKAALEQKP